MEDIRLMRARSLRISYCCFTEAGEKLAVAKDEELIGAAEDYETARASHQEAIKQFKAEMPEQG